VFWAKGYESTTLTIAAGDGGLTAPSLYAASAPRKPIAQSYCSTPNPRHTDGEGPDEGATARASIEGFYRVAATTFLPTRYSARVPIGSGRHELHADESGRAGLLRELRLLREKLIRQRLKPVSPKVMCRGRGPDSNGAFYATVVMVLPYRRRCSLPQSAAGRCRGRDGRLDGLTSKRRGEQAFEQRCHTTRVAGGDL